MVRGLDRWFWIIPITTTKTSIGVVLDAQTFKRMKLSPEAAFLQTLQENPKVIEQMSGARRITEVYATGDFSFRNRQFTGDRWVLAGDAAGFIDPVWSSGVFIAVLSGEKAADMLDRVLKRPERRPLEFRRYERHLGRVMDLYLRLVNSWYTQEFAEVFLNPQEFLQLVPAVNSLLAGNEKPLLQVRWRLWVFNLLVYLQKRFAIVAPRMTLQPNSGLAGSSAE
jgi:flavin-dependent dehydrogenase